MIIQKDMMKRISIFIAVIILICGMGADCTDSHFDVEKQQFAMSQSFIVQNASQLSDIMNVDEITNIGYAHSIELSVEKQATVFRLLRIQVIATVISALSKATTYLSNPIIMTASIIAYGRSVIIRFIHLKDGCKVS